MTYLLYIFILYISIIGYIVFFSVIDNNMPALWSPLLSISVISLGLYPFSLFKIGAAGVITMLSINFALLIISIYSIINRRGRYSFKIRSNLKSSAIILFLFTFAFITLGLLSHNWNYSMWDEFSNWDAVVRSLFRFGEKRIDTTHPSYPPGISLFQYYFVFFTRHTDSIVIFATVIIIVAGVFFLLSNFNHYRKTRLLICAIFPFLTIYLFGFKISTIYVEGVIGILFSALVITGYSLSTHTKENYFYLSIILSFFVLIKDSCIGFAAIFLFLLFHSDLFSQHDHRAWNNYLSYVKERWKILFSVCFLPFLFFLSWQFRNYLFGVKRSHDFANITFGNIAAFFTSSGYEKSHIVYAKIIDWLFSGKLGETGISLYYFMILLCIIVFAYLLFVRPQNKNRFIFYNWTFFLGFLFYVLLLSLIYIFAMDESNAITLTSYDRFLIPYILAWLLFVFYEIYNNANTNEKELEKNISWSLSMLIVSFVLIKTPVTNFFSFPLTPIKDWTLSKQFYTEYSAIIPRGSKIKTIHQGSRGFEYEMIKNLFLGEAIITGSPFGLGEKTDNLNMDYMVQPYSLQEFIDYLEEKKTDFILVGKGDDYFWDTYGSLFNEYSRSTFEIQLFKRVSETKYEKVNL